MDPGGRGGRGRDPNRVRAFLAYLSFNEQMEKALGDLGGEDPLGSFQRASRGGHSVHHAPPRDDASFGRGALWGGHSASPMNESRGSCEWGRRSHGWSRERAHPYGRQWEGPRGSRVMGAQRGPPGADLPGGPRAGSRRGNWGGRDGALQGVRGPSTALGRGGAAAVSGSAGDPGAVGPTSNVPSYAGAVAVDRRSAGPRRGSFRGSVATGPGVPPGRGSMAASSGRGAGRGTREGAGGDRQGVRGGPSQRCIIPGCSFASGGAHKHHAVHAHLPHLFGEISGVNDLSNRQLAQLLELVQFMASTALGCPVEALTVGALQRYWRSAGLRAHPVLPTAAPLMRRLEAFAGWESPAEYSASPPNSFALLLQWNVALSLLGTMGGGQREECRTWQPSSPAPIRAADPAPPATEVPVTVEASPLVSAPTGTPVPVEVEATAGAPASPKAGPSGVGGSVGLGWREVKGKKKRKKKKVGKKPQEAVALADLKAELSSISIGDSRAQGQGEEVMEGVVEGEGGDGSKGVAFPGGRGEGAAPQPSPASQSVGPAFDAHFHLDRLTGKEKGKLSVDLIYKMDVSPRVRIDLKGVGGGGVYGLLRSRALSQCGGFAEDQGTSGI